MDELILVAGNRRISGWTDIRVTVGAERVPNDFEIGMTERFPGELKSWIFQPGDACKIFLGSDLVITGYIDRYIQSISDGVHSIRVVGRGKCCDLVDCAAEWPGSQITGSSAFQIASKLAEPYGISVTCDVSPLPVLPQFNFIIGETAYEIIERICRASALLAYELPDGTLNLTRIGENSAASGIEQGVNVQQATYMRGMDNRYSVVNAFLNSVDLLGDAGDSGNLLATVNDPNVPRHRMMVVIAEGRGYGEDIAKQKALWEVKRRQGRSYMVSVTVDSWRDKAGQLWKPNTLMPIIKLPALHLLESGWVIGEVTYSMSEERGKTADLLLMPHDAFLLQPVLLMPVPADVPQL